MIEKWLWAPLPDLGMVLISAVCIYFGVIAATRLTGLRSFAQFSSFDFAMTIAIGSLISTALLTEDPPLSQAFVGLIAIYGLQKLVALLRTYAPLGGLLDNSPTLLVKDGEILDDKLDQALLTRADLRSILRRENVSHMNDVHAVILETTGDVSVVHSEDRTPQIDPWLLKDVIGSDRFDGA